MALTSYDPYYKTATQATTGGTATSAFDPFYGTQGNLIKRATQSRTYTGVPAFTEQQMAAYGYGTLKSKSEAQMEREKYLSLLGIEQGKLALSKEAQASLVEYQNKTLAQQASQFGQTFGLEQTKLTQQGEQFALSLGLQKDQLAQLTAFQTGQLNLWAQDLAIKKQTAEQTTAGQTVAGVATGLTLADKLLTSANAGTGIIGTGAKAVSWLGSKVLAQPGMESFYTDARKAAYGDTWTGENTSSYGSDFTGSTYGTVSDPGLSYDYPTSDDLGCFITTAAVDTLGLKDDCFELNTLRWFRDNILRKMPNGVQKVQEYYKIAPVIVQNIAKTRDKGIYHDLWATYIYPSVEAILGKKYLTALQVYENMVNSLKRRYL